MKRVLAVGAVILLAAELASGGGQLEVVKAPVGPEGFKQVTMEEVLVAWRIDGEAVRVRVSAPTTGWVAVGFDPAAGMLDANIIIGYVDDGEVRIEDHFGTGRIRHRPDSELGGTVDVSEASGTEQRGRTELAFTMPLDSDDPYDRVLRPGTTHAFLFAYGHDGENNVESYRATRGGFQAEL
jgi:hypothetical protein